MSGLTIQNIVLMKWKSLPFYKRAYWKLKGFAPGGRNDLTGLF